MSLKKEKWKMPNPTAEYLAVPVTENGDHDAVWKPLEFPNVIKGYQVSRYGRIKSPRGKLLVPNKQGNQLWVALRSATASGSTSARVDKLVLAVFLRYEPLMTPHHKDGDSENCYFENLSWREPTNAEIGPLTVALERKQGLRSSKKRGRAVKKTVAPPQIPSVPATNVEMLRVYRLGGLEVAVTPDGGITDLPSVPLSPFQTEELSIILARVVEVNRVMGIK
jgi:hypothetical protein